MIMDLQIIKTEKEYKKLFNCIDIQFDLAVHPESKKGEKLQVALSLIKQFEDLNYAILVPNTLEVVKIKMDENGLKSKNLISWTGSERYVCALLGGKKPLTLKIAKVLHQKLGIPAEVLLR
ncbi:transcriptional regulator [Pedobacter changchengzhani]|uniref:Transcriptional regulator n=1 Tax=Pedobacter changchengzhani TaxID=2529274 RepID=A0A4R5MMS0_9SPHI|nr:transcriptional regulator [Pedobacter changchengzhani]